MLAVEEPTHPIEKPSIKDEGSKTNSSKIVDEASTTANNTDWNPQPPALAETMSTHSTQSSNESQVSSLVPEDQESSLQLKDENALTDEKDKQLDRDASTVESLIDDLSDGINKVARQLSQGLSFDADAKESLDSQSRKSGSSLDSDMTNKLAQPNLVPPDVIANWYFSFHLFKSHFGGYKNIIYNSLTFADILFYFQPRTPQETGTIVNDVEKREGIPERLKVSQYLLPVRIFMYQF